MNNIYNKIKQTVTYDLRKRHVPKISYIAPKIWSLVPKTKKIVIV